MKTREQSARFFEALFDFLPATVDGVDIQRTCSHFGYVEARQLMDYIYGGKPENDSEMIRGDSRHD